MRKTVLGVWAVVLGWAGIADAAGWIVEGPTMSACIKKDVQQKTMEGSAGVPSAFMERQDFIVDFRNTAFSELATSKESSERIVTALCSGRASFSFDASYQLESFTALIKDANFESRASREDYFRFKVKGFLSSEEGNSSFESAWAEILKPADFKGPGPYELTHYEATPLCGRNINLRLDQLEAQARREASRLAVNRISIAQISFRFVPCSSY